MPEVDLSISPSLKNSTSSTMNQGSQSIDLEVALDLSALMHKQPTLNIGMIGHVAHGKSTLTRALSSVVTGKFRKEQEANMTIHLGYANVKIFRCENPYCPPPWRYRAGAGDAADPLCSRPGCASPMKLVRHISLVDAPGHNSLMTTMLSGASVMDAALLLVAADQPCPCPQTQEHLAAAEVLEITSRTLVVQNKIDLCTPRRCAESYLEIQKFLAGSAAQGAPVIPTAAQQGLNLDILCQYIEKIPLPKRDLDSAVTMRIVRSFDVNKPGTKIPDLRGGVAGGALLRGVLYKGQEVEIRPGLLRSDGSFTPVRTKVTSLFSERTPLEAAVPGGLVAVGLQVDSVLTKSNRLVGQVLGAVGQLPPVWKEAEISFILIRALVGSAEDAAEKPKRPKKDEVLLLGVGSAQVLATVIKAGSKMIRVRCKTPVCAAEQEKVVLFRSHNRHWRLIGSGKVQELVELAIPDPTAASESKHQDDQVLRLEVAVDSAVKEGSDDEDEVDEEEAKKEEQLELPPLSASRLAEIQAEFDPQAGQVNTCCRFYQRPLPEVGEVVMIEMERVDEEIGVYCRLLEYDDPLNPLQALIILKEISGRRIRSMKQEVRPGKREAVMVLRADPETGFVDLSRKKVEKKDREKCLERFGASQVVHSIVARVAATLQISVRLMYQHLVWPMQQRSTVHPLETFQLALHDPSALAPYSLPPVLLDSLQANLRHRLKQKPVKVTAKVSLTCFGMMGVEAIREVLTRAADPSQQPAAEPDSEQVLVAVSVESPPLYCLSTLTRSKEPAAQAILGLVDRLSVWMQEKGGACSLVQPPTISV